MSGEAFSQLRKNQDNPILQCAGRHEAVPWRELHIEGELHTGETMRTLYATDASEYQEMPIGVAFPKEDNDIRALIHFARRHKIGLIPRAAGTSLAGQVVGNGLVIDAGLYMNRVLGIEPELRRARVQPGVIRNELNRCLHAHGLFFAPETSTANRAMIAGMVGNNSCGANSILYGSTRDRLVSVRGFLSDGSEATFGLLGAEAFAEKCAGPDCLETRIYRHVRDVLSDPGNRRAILEYFPKPGVTRRNTGYALDALMNSAALSPESEKEFNMCRLLAGSEGTLFFGVEYELALDPLPPPPAVMCAHFQSVAEALRANLIALAHAPSACELIDRHILQCTARTTSQSANRFFLQGDPGALLVIELRTPRLEDALAIFGKLERELRAAELGYAYPVLTGADVGRVWDLRRAGQAVMNNVPGDARPAECVEDTAVDPHDLPAYLAEFDALLREKHGIACVYYGHAGAGEIHTRPLMNLKTAEGRRLFRAVAEDIAALVKKYRGSLSGEHGDGRLRGEFLQFMVGDTCFDLMRRIKKVFDPTGIFNPGKIFDTPPMDTCLRHEPDVTPSAPKTFFDFSEEGGIGGAAKRCNGCAECRKPATAGGTMCPSHMASLAEKDTPRARANLLRYVLTHPPDPRRPLATDSLADVLDLCLSCKGCMAECPTGVDISKIKAEVLQQRHDARGIPLRSLLIAYFATFARLASMFPAKWNFFFGTPALRRIANRVAGFHPERTVPLLARQTFRAWFTRRVQKPRGGGSGGRRVFLFCDEFTDFFEPENGIAAVEVLEKLGYRVEIPRHVESGRAAISKGLLRRARKLARENVRLLASLVSEDSPLLGIEPSALLCFRDEYPLLLRGAEQLAARSLARNCLLLDEFFAREAAAGHLPKDAFCTGPGVIHLHPHCQQKALGSVRDTIRMLELIPGTTVRVIPSGCCGMAGAFGFEAEHFAFSQRVGELVLLPYVRGVSASEILCAPGTSCRHQISDGTGRQAEHPIRILRAALSC